MGRECLEGLRKRSEEKLQKKLNLKFYQEWSKNAEFTCFRRGIGKEREAQSNFGWSYFSRNAENGAKRDQHFTLFDCWSSGYDQNKKKFVRY